jgi:hypothetical protein
MPAGLTTKNKYVIQQAVWKYGRAMLYSQLFAIRLQS